MLWDFPGGRYGYLSLLHRGVCHQRLQVPQRRRRRWRAKPRWKFPPSEVPSTRAPITAWIGSFRITFGGLGRATRTDFGLERRAGTSVGNSAVLPSPSDLDSPFPFLRCLSLASHRRLASACTHNNGTMDAHEIHVIATWLRPIII